MKGKLGAAAVFFVVVLMCTGRSFATLTPLDEEGLGGVTGQAGIAISVSHLDFDIAADNIYYKDSDGIGVGSSAGFYSLCGVKLKGEADFGKPLTIDVATEKDNSGTRVTRAAIKLSDLTLHIESFYIDDRRLGSAPGVGGSLGSFGINNMTIKVSGAMSISAN